MSGWTTLAVRFRAQSEPYGDVRTVGPWFFTVYMRWGMHYCGVMRMTAVDDALYLSAIFLMQFGHPPLRIPWNEIEMTRKTRFLRNYVVLVLGNEEKIPMRISESAACKLGILERIPN
jgi:hypothetical protein